MSERTKLSSFQAFWPFYLSQHAVPACRWLHFGGTTVVVGNLVFSIVTMQPWFIPLSLLFGYGPAWVAHFFVEKNRPATFTYPGWSLIADFKMWAGMLTGKYWTGAPVPPMTEAEAIARAEATT